MRDHRADVKGWRIVQDGLADLRPGRDADGWIEPEALRDLLAGELPDPLALRFACLDLAPAEASEAIDRAREASPPLRRSLPRGKSRSVLFDFWLEEADRGLLLASLRGALAGGAWWTCC